MASFLQRVFSLSLGDVKGAFRTSETVRIEKDPNDAAKEILRFGDGKDDYFKLEGSRFGKEGVREIIAKVVESPSQLKKIRDLPLEDRPTLKMEYAGLMTGGYCDGNVINLSPMMGTGYKAAAVFCHEFQHQYQFKKGNGMNAGKDLNLSSSILNDRIMEAGADIAAFQYLYEMKTKNPQVAVAIAEFVADGSTGFVNYAAAKMKGKSEQACILAGMEGYAANYMNAVMYERGYHPDVQDTDKRFADFSLYADNVKSAVGAGYYMNAMGMNKKKLDEFDAFKSHTVGLTDEKPNEAAVRKTLRSPKFDFVTGRTARAITRWTEHLKKGGYSFTENPDKLNVKTLYGTTNNKKRGGLGGLMYRAKTKFLSVVDTLKNGKEKASFGSRKYFLKRDGIPDMILTSGNDGKPQASVRFFADARLPEADAVKKLGKKEVEKRTEAAQKMFGILMKQPAFKRQVDEMHKNGVEINLSFSDAVKEPRTIQGNTILLNPHQKPKQLAEQFVRQFVPAVRESIAAKQAAPKQQTVPEATQAKPIEKQSENHVASKVMEQLTVAAKTVEPRAAEPTSRVAAFKTGKTEINGEALLKMVDQLAFRTSKSNQSDTYYKPTPVETKLIDAVAKYSKDMVKSAGIDARSAQAKPFRAKCLAEWAQSPQGKSGVVKLMQAYGNMKAFEKPREKQPLMQTLQARTTPQAQPQQPIKQAAVAKTQESQGR